ncbi:MAG: polyphosphate polymerase domain-containing protein [Phycisphaerales bacterium]
MSAPESPDPVRSPSLDPRAEGPAFELKFLVDGALAARLEEGARRLLAPDPFGDAAGAYHTTTLYLDTRERDVLHRSPGFRTRKYRIRRYGLTTQVYLERKTRREGRVAKRRSDIPEADLAVLAGLPADGAWTGRWFHERVLRRRLAPAALVSYRRTALVGPAGGTPMRLTIDRGISGVPCDQWRLAPAAPPAPARAILDASAIVELKFLVSVPRLFKDLMTEYRLSPAAVSKYRLCQQAWQAGAAARGATRA